jgi:hypothetical protein
MISTGNFVTVLVGVNIVNVVNIVMQAPPFSYFSEIRVLLGDEMRKMRKIWLPWGTGVEKYQHNNYGKKDSGNFVMVLVPVEIRVYLTTSPNLTQPHPTSPNLTPTSPDSPPGKEGERRLENGKGGVETPEFFGWNSAKNGPGEVGLGWVRFRE